MSNKINDPYRLTKEDREVIFLEELTNHSLRYIIGNWAGGEVGVDLNYENFALSQEEERKYKQIRAKIKELEKEIRDLNNE